MSSGRILHCIPTMGGGGAERQLAYLAEELARIGWEVHVALMRRGPNWDRLARSGAVIHELTAWTAYDPRVFRGLRRVITEVKPDIIQAWLLQMEVLGGLAALVTGKPWIFSERASEGAYAPTVKNLLRRGIARYASAIVSNSAAGDRYWRAHLGTRIRRYIIPNGIPLGEIAATPAATADEVGIDSDQPLVMFAGRLAPEKNIDALLRALQLVLARHHQARVLCCGEGPLRASVLRWIEEQGVGSRFRVMGYTPRLWGMIKRAAVFISPSLFEGSPNVVLEAMACGVPLVVSDIPEHRELLDEAAAVLVVPTSAERLAQAIESVLQDPGSAAARARVAHERVARYGLPNMAQQYSDMYREVLSSQAAV